jgi:plastocyanin
MFVPDRLKHPTPITAGMLALFAAACSPGANRTPPAESATSAPPSRAVETSTARFDSTTAVQAQSVSVARPATPKPRVRPSIDPGRKISPPKPADSSSSAAAAPSTSQNQALKYDAGTNTVTFDLIGGPNGFQFNGYASGGATLTLPPKANVVMSFVNKDGTPHSAEIISGQGPLPNAAVDAAIPRAYTNQLLQGLPQESGDVMKFQVPQSGTYRIFCGVPGHGLSGMWIWMKVDPAAKTPSFGPTKA